MGYGRQLGDTFDAFKDSGVFFNENTAVVLVAAAIFRLAEAVENVSTSLDDIERTLNNKM